MGRGRLAKVEMGNLEVVGYSVGGEETVVAVPSLNVCFDVGKAPEEILTIDHVLLSHGHMDHAAGIAYYLSQRDFREMAAGTVLLPRRLAPAVESLLDCWGRLDGTRPPARIVGMAPGDEFEIRRNLFAFAFATNHGADSLGFTIIERRQKLRPELADVPGQEIARRRKAGEAVTYTINLPLVTYLGDTTGGDFEQLACVRHSEVLIAECTFFDPEHRERARAGRHYHWDELAGVIEGMENKQVLLTHLSRRTELAAAKKMVAERLSPETAAKVRFLMDRRAAGRRESRK